MEEFTALIAWAAQALAAWSQANPILAEGVSFACRLLAPMLTLLILVRTIRSLLTVPAQPEVWAVLGLPNGVKVPLTRWENIMGRSPSADVVVNYPSVSRQHAAIIRRGDDADWTVYDLGSKMGTSVNGQPVEGSAPVTVGDTVELGGVPMVLIPVDDKELSEQVARRRRQVPISPWLPLIALTALQVLCGFQLFMAGGAEASPNIVLSFLALPVMMWLYFLLMRATGRVGFEMEIIAFFLSTLSMAVTASSAPSSLPKQMIALILGLGLFLVLGLLLRDLKRVQKLRWLMAAGCIGLLAITLVLGTSQFGATNWIRLGPLSFQPSEIAKICYIFAGSATLERLFRRRNLALFIVLTGVCIGLLGLMSDFGTAAIFFVTFLVIAYLRSGDAATLALICGGAAFGAGIIVQFKPYILSRFAAWGHAWEAASGSGYQQTRTMSAAASGGLFGMGAGNGWLERIPAGDTDLVFGMLCEEWGLVIALLAVACILTLAWFAVRASRTGRSSFYTIAACAAGSLLVFQTSLNVFGSVDLLPLTGVTFPFVSNGGSAMLSAWGLLAYLKAMDTRADASFAIGRAAERKLDEEAARMAAPAEDAFEKEDGHAED